MKHLIFSGLGAHLDQDAGRVGFDQTVTFRSYTRKCGKDMQQLLCDPSGIGGFEPVYDTYRQISEKKDAELFSATQYNYDFTVLMPNKEGRECMKTSGHYHGSPGEGGLVYPEVYEVVLGRVLFMLQKNTSDSNEVAELLFAELSEGQSLVIPPDYGHCSVNMGDGISIFSSLSYDRCPIDYRSVRDRKGMSYYAFCKKGEIAFKKNINYKDPPKPKWIAFRDSTRLGISAGSPVYRSFVENPGQFRYLEDPQPYLNEILSSIEYLPDETFK